MTEVQAAEVINIVLKDQRIAVLNEVRAIIAEERDNIEDTLALDVLDAKLNTLMQRCG